MKRIAMYTLTVLALGSSSYAKEDPDLFKPQNTTGGQIGLGVGLAAGTAYGGPEAGISAGASGMLIGHGLDRATTRTSNDLTGPAWHRLERSNVGKKAGKSFKKLF